MLILKILICFYLSKICGACNPSLFNSRPQVSERKICTQEGRFVNSEDTTCSTYYVCALQNESLVPKKYSCPLGTLFDPNLRVCSAIYKCSSSSAVTFNNANSSEFSLTSCMLDKDSTENFVCYEKGRFVNPKDLTCTTYFLCSLLHNGSFVQTIYSCPVGSFFDPELHLCSELYQCPCSTTTSSTTTSPSTICYAAQNITENFICNKKGRFINPKDMSCTTYFLCSLLRNGSFIQTKYSCPKGSYFDPELHLCSELFHCPCLSTSKSDISSTTRSTTSLITTASTKYSSLTTPASCFADTNNEDNFTCSEKGRFVNPKDPSCTTYFLCSLLHNGSLIQTQYLCPKGSYFDPKLHLCSELYHCPCSSTSKSDISSTTRSTTSLITTASTKYSSLTTPTSCFADINNKDNFTCSEKGRFVNPKDPSCTTYFLCSLLRNGSLIQTQYPCPKGSYFDPELHLCSELYHCPCSSTSKSDISSTTRSTTSLSTTSSTKYSSLTTPASCFADINNEDNFTCSEKGRFVNLKDPSCTTYFLCSLLHNGSLIQTQYPCPKGSYFDPKLHLCSELYHCPCSSTSKSDISSTTRSTTSLITTASTKYSSLTTPTSCFADINNKDNFTCSEKGRFVNPKDPSCTTYFLCSLLRNGSLIQTQNPCPKGSYFDPELHLCSELYHCPCSSTSKSDISSTTRSTTSLSTTSSTKYSSLTTPASCFADINNEDNFTCSEKGRFVNPKDPSCTTYFLCSLLRNGSLIQTQYPCPKGSFFDPELHLCSELYHCPCSTTTKADISPTTTTSAVCFADINNEEAFTCSRKGRFINPKDPSCTTYFLCSLLRNGSFVQTEYPCPNGSFFDPELQICNVLYHCPCSERTTTMAITTSTSDPCIPPETTDFTCSAKGRFQNKLDVSCTSYYLCNLLRNGSFVQSKYFCPSGSYFDPAIHICTTEYKCPCNF
nr:PREDICTED: uncharacterized protein LOC103312740 [Tribolium castaneum]XP_015835072.1 PREDICTED: uncharacterized protein LOC103312740 [Tribolium castaneum]|eukprot:XP_015835071.1 PREDICTED: uncharacterized protein LOC103312740 [Tribolium castaneum]